MKHSDSFLANSLFSLVPLLLVELGMNGIHLFLVKCSSEEAQLTLDTFTLLDGPPTSTLTTLLIVALKQQNLSSKYPSIICTPFYACKVTGSVQNKFKPQKTDKENLNLRPSSFSRPLQLWKTKAKFNLAFSFSSWLLLRWQNQFIILTNNLEMCWNQNTLQKLKYTGMHVWPEREQLRLQHTTFFSIPLLVSL